jgi:hypothetical protein
MIDPSAAGRRDKIMGHSAAERLGKLPKAVGTITRLAYAHAKASGIDTQALLSEGKSNAAANQKPEPQTKGCRSN